MSGRKSRVRSLARWVTLVCASVLILGTAWGPAKIASAFGAHESPPSPADAPSFVPPPFPVLVESPTVRLSALQKVIASRPVELSDGTMSPPDTVYLRFSQVELDNLKIRELEPRLGGQPPYVFTITNAGSGSQTATIGNKGAVTELWTTVRSLAICITAQTLDTVITTYAGVLGGRVDGLLQLVGSIFGPLAASPLGPVGPCVQLPALLPVLEVLLDYGVPLPGVLPVADLDIEVYALSVKTAPNAPSITLPRASIKGEQ